MTKKIQFSLDFDADIEEYLRREYPGLADYRITNQSLDARGAPKGRVPVSNYTVEVIFAGESFLPTREKFKDISAFKNPPIIIGAGPCGLFSALRFSEYNIKSIVLERGERADKRMLHIAKFWRYGLFDRENNVCYGEGGAGLFSDGKLITRIKSPYVQYVMNRLVDFGAPLETAYLSNPHLGSNKIRAVINKLTDYLREKGTVVRYNTKVESLLLSDQKVIGVMLSSGEKIYSDYVILATGHSAGDVYEHLKKINVKMDQKDFAIGVRIEHPRHKIDKIQYGNFSGEKIGPARYRLSYEDSLSKKGTYSFCMCPGGYVLSSGTEENGIVVNGMSNYRRNGPWSNSALVVSVKAGIDFKNDDVLNGMYFQREIEQKAFLKSKEFGKSKELPSLTVNEFLNGKINHTLPLLKTSSPSGIFKTDLTTILPSFITNHLQNAIVKFDTMMKGFICPEANLIAPETRTSAPVTILRDQFTLESLSHKGLYPGGEGAGHAGGITSAAVDGVKIAMEIIKKEKGYIE